MREPCLTLLDWQLLLDGQILVGYNPTLIRVAKTFKICERDKELEDSFVYKGPDDDMSA
jgi:hypothetical protein